MKHYTLSNLIFSYNNRRGRRAFHTNGKIFTFFVALSSTECKYIYFMITSLRISSCHEYLGCIITLLEVHPHDTQSKISQNQYHFAQLLLEAIIGMTYLYRCVLSQLENYF